MFVVCIVCVLRHSALYQNSKSAIKPVLVASCMKAAIHWFSSVRASAGGVLKAIETIATNKDMTKVLRAFRPLKFC